MTLALHEWLRRHYTWAVELYLTPADAEDPEIATVMSQIAADEAEHAELAWSVHDFFLSRLDVVDRAHIGRALEDAVTQLTDEVVRAEWSDELEAQAGVPSRRASLEGLTALRAHVEERAAYAIARTCTPS